LTVNWRKRLAIYVGREQSCSLAYQSRAPTFVLYVILSVRVSRTLKANLIEAATDGYGKGGLLLRVADTSGAACETSKALL
jgi:hypothetical protein